MDYLQIAKDAVASEEKAWGEVARLKANVEKLLDDVSYWCGNFVRVQAERDELKKEIKMKKQERIEALAAQVGKWRQMWQESMETIKSLQAENDRLESSYLHLDNVNCAYIDELEEKLARVNALRGGVVDMACDCEKRLSQIARIANKQE